MVSPNLHSPSSDNLSQQFGRAVFFTEQMLDGFVIEVNLMLQITETSYQYLATS